MENENKREGFRKHFSAEAGFNVSWSSIFAGVVTFFATLAVLSLISSAIGFGTVEPTASDPFSGVGTGVLIWTVVTMVLAFMAGGFVAGMASRRVGVLHGFLTWATSILLLLVMLTMITTTALSSVGSLFGSAFSVAGDGAASIASGVETVVETGVESSMEGLEEIDIDMDEVEADINKILEDTETAELQPGYLNEQLRESQNEIMEAGKELVVNPEDAEEILTTLMNSLEEKAQTIGNAVDRDAIAKSVSKNTDLDEEEAEKVTDNIYEGIETSSKQVERSINEASFRIEKTKEEIDQTIVKARVEADKAADVTAQASIWAFVGLVIAMILTSLSGFWGSNFVEVRNEETM